MEIRIKTAQEFRDAHVTIEIRAQDQDEAARVAERELIDVRAEVKRLRAELEHRFTSAEVEDAKAGAREDARAEVTREKVQPMEQDLAALADLLGKVNGLALGSEVRRALGKNWETADGRAISEALRGIRDVLGAWTPRSV